MTQPFKLPVIQPTRLQGTCNRCGLCCTPNGLRCHYLEIEAKIGEPYASRCKVYKTRFPGMTIFLLSGSGVVEAVGACTHGSPEDDKVIRPFIGKGCSLHE